MSRGGKRDGAGRKPDLLPEDAKLIREDYEQRARQVRKVQWEKGLGRQLKKRDIEPNPGELKCPKSWTPERVFEFRAKYNPIVSEYGLSRRKVPEGLPMNVEHAIMKMRHNRQKGIRKRYFSTQDLPRLYRGRQAVIEAVAHSWGISSRMVRTIIEADTGV
ncbi:hypothetical protein JQ617_06915 [Bradyrhizobium sp. KB893862 SZCCT0404]|uniref:hypothetical protein n=1 Tax=Bradyrhizobium sp. KB893862 SZCCT0404 TaxID=2807672 RepID=UPI001BA78A1C|nr:hypothetical protein [Bradyrhizobium sp. KB893862 SZCCT0404]MBR1173681.1 hypothetical protein [Bradyrhizobium sp. KB893862 SZCCT0404]